MGIPQTATESDIRKAYRTLALSHHPDKNPGREAAASEQFKAVQHSYSVLSDPHERAWYDAHRTQILRGHDPATADPDAPPDPANATEVDLFSCFSSSAYRGFADGADGFFGVYDDVFSRLWQEEVAELAKDGKHIPPTASFGGYDADWDVVRAFYARWEGFSSVKTFSFADKWHLGEAPNREVRRLMEKDNKKARVIVRKEFNSTIRELAAFVKKRDPRVARRRKEEQKDRERKAEEAKEREKAKKQLRKDNAELMKAARDEALEEDADGLDQILEAIAQDERMDARSRKKKKSRRQHGDASGSENETSRSEAVSDAETEDDVEEQSENGAGPDGNLDYVTSDSDEEVEEEEDLYCVACKKAFRTAAQKTDHERSKKHKSAVAKLKRQILKEEKAFAKANPTLAKELPRSSEPNGRAGQTEGHTQSGDGSGNDASDDEAQFLRAKAKKSKKKRKKQFAQTLGGPIQDGDGNSSAKEASGPDGDETSDVGDVMDNADNTASTQAGEDFTEPEIAAEAKQPQLTKKQKRRLREQKKKEQGEDAEAMPSSLKCNICRQTFPSRTKLMRHVDQSRHALHVPETATSNGSQR